MTEQSEVSRLKRRLDATFERVKDVGDDTELQSDFAKYLCVLVSGYMEQAIVHIVLEHAREKGAPTLEHFVQRRTKRFANAKVSRILQLMGDFDPDWHKGLKDVIKDEQKAAIDSIVDQRNKIAHGGSVELTYRRIWRYYEQAQCVIDQVAAMCLSSAETS